MELRNSKRNHPLSGDEVNQDFSQSKSQKRKRLSRSKKTGDSGSRGLMDQKDAPTPVMAELMEAKDVLPEEMPSWGIKLLEILQNTIKAEVHSVSSTIAVVDENSTKNTQDVKLLEKKFNTLEQRNKVLESENDMLKEKLLDLEYKQRKNNLIFEGIIDSPDESDLLCIERLRYVLKDIPGLDVKNFRIDRCY